MLTAFRTTQRTCRSASQAARISLYQCTFVYSSVIQAVIIILSATRSDRWLTLSRRDSAVCVCSTSSLRWAMSRGLIRLSTESDRMEQNRSDIAASSYFTCRCCIQQNDGDEGGCLPSIDPKLLPWSRPIDFPRCTVVIHSIPYCQHYQSKPRKCAAYKIRLKWVFVGHLTSIGFLILSWF